mgnify:CR=1 FL=1
MKENNMMSYEMYEDFKETMVKTIKTELAAKTANNNQSSDNDLSQRLEQIVYTEQERHQAIIIQLAGRLESIEQNYTKTQTGIDNLQASVEAIKIPAELPPRIIRHRVIFSSESPFVIYLVLFLFISCMILSSALYFATRPNHDRIDNDLKYRYIRMKGEASPENISGLENIFGFNRDNGKINQMRKDVEAYEEAVHERAALIEQARLKERAARELGNKADSIRGRNSKRRR